TPATAPLSAAMTGLRTSHARSVRRSPRSCSLARASSKTVPPPSRSAPTQKSRPAPVTTTARTSSRSSACRSASRISMPMRRVHALRRSGRFSVSVATWSATSRRICSYSMVPPSMLGQLQQHDANDDRRDAHETQHVAALAQREHAHERGEDGAQPRPDRVARPDRKAAERQREQHHAAHAADDRQQRAAQAGEAHAPLEPEGHHDLECARDHDQQPGYHASPSCSRSRWVWTLLYALRGSAGTNSIRRGRLNPARRVPTNAPSDSSSIAEPSRPTPPPVTASPPRGCGGPIP